MTMNTTPTVLEQPSEQTQDTSRNGNPGHWPHDVLEAYARYRGPYTIENAETLLEEEPIELYNGWLVWQTMTDYYERRVVATLQVMLDVSARKAGFGQALPDQVECLLDSGDVVKPDASLISWVRAQNDVISVGPRGRPVLQGGPELVVEVRSPSNRRAQERRKRALYFANGVQIVWDVDEPNKTIWVYRAETPDTPLRLGINDEIECEPLLPDWRRHVADIFAEQASAEAVLGEVAADWRSQGRTEGSAATLRDVLPLLITARFQTEPPPDLSARLAQCNLTQLQTLQAAVMTSPSLNEWLAQLPDSSKL
jgi:Uma2 family endonuclease